MPPKERKKKKAITFANCCQIRNTPLLSHVGEYLASIPLDEDRNAFQLYSAQQKGVKLAGFP